MNIDIFDFKQNEGIKFDIISKELQGDVTVYTFSFEWNKNAADFDQTIEFSWSVPQNGLLYTWSQNSCLSRFLPRNYLPYNHSMISYNSPCIVMFNGKSEHKYSWALDECSKLVYFKSGIDEWDAKVHSYVKIPLKQFANKYSTTFPIKQPDKNNFVLLFLYLSNKTIKIVAPTPYTGQNGPNIRPFLLSIIPIVI